MGWKSTIDISRDQAISVILSSQDRKKYETMTNNELEDMMSELGIGDDPQLPYHGHNFNITD
jgi:hypothetical protein